MSGPTPAAVSPRPSAASACCSGSSVRGIRTLEKSRVCVSARALSASAAAGSSGVTASSGRPATHSPLASRAVLATARYASYTASALASASSITLVSIGSSSTEMPCSSAALASTASSSTCETRIVGQMPAWNRMSRRGLDLEARISGMVMVYKPTAAGICVAGVLNTNIRMERLGTQSSQQHNRL